MPLVNVVLLFLFVRSPNRPLDLVSAAPLEFALSVVLRRVEDPFLFAVVFEVEFGAREVDPVVVGPVGVAMGVALRGPGVVPTGLGVGIGDGVDLGPGVGVGPGLVVVPGIGMARLGVGVPPIVLSFPPGLAIDPLLPALDVMFPVTRPLTLEV